jgi:hypothetical protein
MVKRMYFFKGGMYFEYDPRPSADRVVKGPIPIATRFKALESNANFSSGLDAAVNWGDGFVYFFKGDQYWKYDALSDLVDTPAPRQIDDGWPTFPASFQAGIDAAFNSGTGKAYFFKGDEYIRYDIANDRLDAPDPGTPPYPRKIADPNGWHGLPLSFRAGIDAAVFAADGKIYFFKNEEYVKLTFASRTVDVVAPPYPLKIDLLWSGLPATLDAGVEWIQAGTATLTITKDPCKTITKDLTVNVKGAITGQRFEIEATFESTGHPSVCGCAEYRQFVQGDLVKKGKRIDLQLPDPNGKGTVPLKSRAADGTDSSFQEDGRERSLVLHYGHRKEPQDLRQKYDRPDQRSGCHYKAEDTPSISDVAGTGQVVINLNFRGEIIDVAADDEVLVTEKWDIFCSGEL